MTPSPEIWHRDDFAVLATWRKYTRVIEIGVDRGAFASCFLSRWINGEVYLGVDPYLPYPEMPFNRDGDFFAAATVFARHHGIAKLVREKSSVVAAAFASALYYYTRPYDLVYIDGAHDYASVKADLEAWWPIIAEGGMLAGHDWHDESGDNADVQRAVLDFAGDRQVFFTSRDNPSSWYLYKNASPMEVNRL